MGKRNKRTGKVYFEKTIDKFIIDKDDEDLTLMEISLLKTNPDKYTTVKPYIPNYSKEEKTDEEIEEDLEKREKKLRKMEQKENEKLWKFYEKYKKNPKKFEKGLTKAERRVLKFFNKKSKKEKTKYNKQEKKLKKMKKNLLIYTIYLMQQKEIEDFKLKSELITGIPFKDGSRKKKKDRFFTECNPNKRFSQNNRDYDDVQIQLLEDLENEIIDKLNSPEIFTDDLEIFDYSKSSGKKSNKKKTVKDLTRLMI